MYVDKGGGGAIARMIDQVSDLSQNLHTFVSVLCFPIIRLR